MFLVVLFFFFKQKTAYEMRISDWSSDVCSSDLYESRPGAGQGSERLEDYQQHHRHEQQDGNFVEPAVELVRAGVAALLEFAQYRAAGMMVADDEQIGRASCRERVSQSV